MFRWNPRHYSGDKSHAGRSSSVPFYCLDSENHLDIALFARIHVTLGMLEPDVRLDPTSQLTANVTRLPQGRFMSPQVGAVGVIYHVSFYWPPDSRPLSSLNLARSRNTAPLF